MERVGPQTVSYQFERIERRPIVAEITRRLLDYLLSGELRPGDKLPTERKLAELLGVGRSSIREALKALTVLGLLEVRQGDGTYLKKAQSDLLPQVIEWGLLLGEKRTRDLMEARQKIEIAVAELAALRCDDGGAAALKEHLERMRRAAEAGDTNAFIEADLAFHRQLADIAQNTVLRDILSSIKALLQTWIRSVIESAGNADFSYREHLAVYEAVAARDGAGAAAAMERHMNSAATRLHRQIQESEKVAQIPDHEPEYS